MPYWEVKELFTALEDLAAIRAQLAERDAEVFEWKKIAGKAHAENIELNRIKAELEALKGHAENMCRILQMGDGGFDRPETAAYRAAFPKEADK